MKSIVTELYGRFVTGSGCSSLYGLYRAVFDLAYVLYVPTTSFVCLCSPRKSYPCCLILAMVLAIPI